MNRHVDFGNSRSQPAERLIGPANVHSLTVKWVFTTGGDVSATPTVFGDAVFFPDWAGNLYAVNKHTGQLIWSHEISDYDGFPAAISRNSPAIHGNDIIVGDIETRVALHNSANIIAADRTTGALHWITRVDSHVSAEIGVMYAGSQSGSMYALDASTGKILWSFASGGSVIDGPSIVDGVLYWGSGYSNPGTGNNKLYAFSIKPRR